MAKQVPVKRSDRVERRDSKFPVPAFVFWAVVAVVGWFVLKAVIGTIFWLLRAALVVGLIVAAVWFLSGRKRRD